MSLYISVDIESSGSHPPRYSMLSLGAVAFEDGEKYMELDHFYVELQPLPGSQRDQRAMEVNSLDFKALQECGTPPLQAMKEFWGWLNILEIKTSSKLILVAAPIRWDGMFLYWYFQEFVGNDPTGHNGVDIRSYWMALSGEHYLISKDRIKSSLGLSGLEHSHHALDDAREQAKMFHAMLRRRAEILQGGESQAVIL